MADWAGICTRQPAEMVPLRGKRDGNGA